MEIIDYELNSCIGEEMQTTFQEAILGRTPSDGPLKVVRRSKKLTGCVCA